jgi:hypothetical protein
MWARPPFRKRVEPRKVKGERRPPRGQAKPVFREDAIVDAPEHYEYARGMGLLTWGTWDTEVRPLDERLKDFLQACPAIAPARFHGSMLARNARGEYGAAEGGARLARFHAQDNHFGTIVELLARYGLKLREGAAYKTQPVEVLPFRDMALLRNQRLRQLYGAVDIEPENMDEAKAAELDGLEKKRAAEQIREARHQMHRRAEEGAT